MKKNSKSNKRKSNKDFDVVRDIVVKRILETMEEGQIPWNKPWFGTGKCYAYVSKRPYNALNEMMLDEEGGYVTSKQLHELGGKMKDGIAWKDRCKAVVGCFRKTYEVKDVNGDPIMNDNGEPLTKTYSHLKYWYVVNVKYTTLPEKNIKGFALGENTSAEQVIKDYLNESGVKLHRQRGDRAFYRPATDSVTVPLISQFKDRAEYYSTVFHELGHSTGHMSRENRFTPDSYFGNEPYAREELVAEFTAAIMNNMLAINSVRSDRNSAAYIQSWAKAIKDDPNMFTYACFKADKAVLRILCGKKTIAVEVSDETAA